MSYHYSQEAKERITTLGHVAITEFIEEIPQSLLKDFYKSLPKVRGFRPGSVAEAKEKQKRLIVNMTSQQGQKGSLAWTNFGSLWEIWARAKIGDDFPKLDGTSSINDDASTFLNNLAEIFPRAARENVERLLKFSFFPNEIDINVELNKFDSAEDIEHKKIVDELPDHFLKIKARLEVSERNDEEILNRVEQLEINSASYASISEAANISINQHSDSIAKMRAVQVSWEESISSLKQVVDGLSSSANEKAKVISTIKTHTLALEESISELMSYKDDWDRIIKELVDAKTSIATLTTQKAEWETVVDNIRAIDERIAVVENVLVNGGGGTTARLKARLLENSLDGPFVDIFSVEDACNLIASNLQAVGIMKGDGISKARQIVSALIAGQMVQFSGSLANFIADAVVAAVGGPSYHEWKVPVGLVSDEVALECIKSVNQSSGCLVLRGANLSAFEVYGSAIRDIVVRRQFGGTDCGSCALVASWAQGAAVFPGGGMLAELGPVFDTDTLSMRGSSAKRPPLQFGRLAKGSWMELDNFNVDSSARITSDFSDILNEIKIESGLWKRMANRIYMILSAMPDSSPQRDIHSLLVFWAIPYAKATGGPVEEIIKIAERELAELRTEAIV